MENKKIKVALLGLGTVGGGEIRQAGKNYYVWVRETIGGSTEEKVYVIYPEKEFVMKISACYVV